VSGLPAVPEPPGEPEPARPEAALSERDRDLLRYFVGLAWAEHLKNLERERTRR